MKTALGIALGLLGGILLNLVIGFISVAFTGGTEHSPDSSLWDLPTVAWTTLLWAIAAAILLYHARSSLVVIRRGSILGIVLWTLMIPFGPVAVTRVMMRLGHSDSNFIGVASSIIIGAAVFMVIVCAGCLAGTYIAARQTTKQVKSPVLPKTA